MMQSLKTKQWLFALKKIPNNCVWFLKNFQKLFQNAPELMNLKISNVWKNVYNKHVKHRTHIFE